MKSVTMCGGSTKLFALLLLCIFCCRSVITMKLKLASAHDCDRHSLDALYYEKYAPETENVLTDITEFVNNAADRMVDSLIAIMADLPGRESSSTEERAVYAAFGEMKRKFARNVNKLKRNMTSAWESLIEAHNSLMLDDGKFSLSDVLNRTNYVADTYASSRSALDTNLGSVISALKDIVSHSLQGISAVVETELKNEELEKEKSRKSNTSEDSDDDDSNEEFQVDEKSGDANQEFNKDELLKNKKKEMIKSLTPNFLGKVTLAILDKDINLGDDVKSEDRDSVLDDMYFTLVMIRSRANSIIHKDSLRTKEVRDLARRNLYIYFADRANEMYKDRIKEKRDNLSTDSDKKPHSWKDEDDLAEALLRLLENYP